MQLDDVTVEVRRPDLSREGQIPMKYITDLQLIKSFNSVGSWSLHLPVELPIAQMMVKPGYGIIVTGPDDKILMSGPMISATHDQTTDDPQGTWLIQGADDNIYLADALAFPVPLQPDVTLQIDSHDVRTGAAEDVLRGYFSDNIGPTSPVGRRPATALGLGTYHGGIGGTVTGSARFDQLGLILSQVASVGGLGFDMQQNGSTVLLQTYAPVDRSRLVRMDIDNDQLTESSYGYGSPTGTRVIVAGQGQEELRTFIQVTSTDSTAAEALWHRKIEVFKDRRDTDDPDVLEQEGVDDLSTGGTTVVSLKVKPADVTTMIYAEDWYLGDIVTVTVDQQDVTDVVTGAVINIGPGGVQVGAVVGDPTGFDYESQLVAAQQSQEQRLAFLEKNAEVGRPVDYDPLSASANEVVNGSFRVNQRGYVSGASIPIGSYAFDRWKASGVVNLITNPSAETNTTGWAASGVTFSRDTGFGVSGSCSFKLVGTASNDSFIVYSLPTTIGKTYTVSATARLTGALTGAELVSTPSRARAIYAYDGVGTLGASAQAPNAAGVTRVSVTFVARLTSSNIRLYHGQTGGTIWWDAVMATEGDVLYPYFDGSTADSSWSGAAHASASYNVPNVVPTLTFSSDPDGQTVTLNSGARLSQIIEQENIVSGAYTVAHDGTAQVRVYNNTTAPGSRPAFAAGPVHVTLDGTDDVVVEFVGGGTISNARLYPGATDFGFVLPSVGDELRACQRYYIRHTADVSGELMAQGGLFTTNPQIRASWFFPTTMRTTPFQDSSAASTFQALQEGIAVIVGSSFSSAAPNTTEHALYVVMILSTAAGFVNGGWGTIIAASAGAYLGADAEVY